MLSKNSLTGRLGAVGFTLIELLVVVLIIGILAAVALPQYKKAVAKAHLANLKALVAPVAAAAERYRMATGDFPQYFEELDVTVPPPSSSSCTANPGGLDCANYYDWGRCVLVYQKPIQYFVGCYQGNLGYIYYLSGTTSYPKGPACRAQDKDNVSLSVCKQETAKTTPFYSKTGGTQLFTYSN